MRDICTKFGRQEWSNSHFYSVKVGTGLGAVAACLLLSPTWGSPCWHAASGSSSSSVSWARCMCSTLMGTPASLKVIHVVKIGGWERQIQISGCPYGFLFPLPHVHLFFSCACPAEHRPNNRHRGSSLVSHRLFTRLHNYIGSDLHNGSPVLEF